MSKLTKQLANAERVADEAIAALNNVLEVLRTELYINHPKGITEAMTHFLSHTHQEVMRLRSELEDSQ